MKGGGSTKKKKRASSSGSSPASPEPPSSLSSIEGDEACSSGELDDTSIFQRTLEEGEMYDPVKEAAVLARHKKKLKLSDSNGADINIGEIIGNNQDGEAAMDEESETTGTTVKDTAPPSGGAGNNVVYTLTVYMCAVSGETLANHMRRQPVAFRKEFVDTFGEARDVRLARGSVKVVCRTTDQRAALLKTTNFMQRRVRVTPPQGRAVETRVRSEVKGVIGGVSVEVSDEEIRGEVEVAGVTGVKRIMRHEGGRVVPTAAVILTFKGAQLPQKVDIGCLRYKVREYVPPVVRCYKCQGFSHKAAQCKVGLRCVRCSGAHAFDDCPGKENREAVDVRCANCKGNHSAAFRGCKGYVEVHEALKIVTKEKLSYKDALMKVRHVQQGVQPAAPKVAHKEDASRRGEVQQQQPPAGQQQQQQQQQAQQQQAQLSPGPRRKLVFQPAPAAPPSVEPSGAKSSSPARTKAVMTDIERCVQQVFRAMLGVLDAYIPIQSKPEFVAAAKDAVREATGIQLPAGIPGPYSKNFINGFAPPPASGPSNAQSPCI